MLALTGALLALTGALLAGCSAPGQTVESGSYNFCRFALYQPHQQCQQPTPEPPRQQLQPDAEDGGPDPREQQEQEQWQQEQQGREGQQEEQEQQQEQWQEEGQREQWQQREAAAGAGHPRSHATPAAAGPPGSDCSGCGGGNGSRTCLVGIAGGDPGDVGVWELGAEGVAPRRRMLFAQRKPQPTRGMCMALQLFQVRGWGAGRWGARGAGGAGLCPAACPSESRASCRRGVGGQLVCLQSSLACADAMPAHTLQRPGGGTGADSLCALCAYEDGSVALWEARQPGSCLAAAKLHQETCLALAVAPAGDVACSGGADGTVHIFGVDVAAGKLGAAAAQQLPQAGVADIGFRGDGRLVATAGWDGKVRLYHGRKRTPLAVLRYHAKQVACVGFGGEGGWLASGGRDGMVALWQPYPLQ